MAQLILILGDLAAGKSTLAQRLSKQTKTLCLIKDTMKELLADDIGFTTRAENKKLSIGAVSMMKYVLSQYAPFGKDLILEANFHQDEIEYFYKEASDAGYSFVCLFLEGNIDELYERFTHRIKFEHRHRAHMTADILEKSGFTTYLQKSREEVTKAQKTLECTIKDTSFTTIKFVTIKVQGDNFDEVYDQALASISTN